jgi:hypothetical protein
LFHAGLLIGEGERANGLDGLNCRSKVVSMSISERVFYSLFILSEIVGIGAFLVQAPWPWKGLLSFFVASSVLVTGMPLKRTHPHLRFLAIFTAVMLLLQMGIIAIDD